MHISTIILGASLASVHALQPFGPGPDLMSYLTHMDAENEGQNQQQNQGQNEGQNQGQNESQKARYNGNTDGNFDGNYDSKPGYDDSEDYDVYNSYYQDPVPSSQAPTPAQVHIPESSRPIHSTFVVRPSPAVVSNGPAVASSRPHAQAPASGYSYNYPSPAASKPMAFSSAPVASSAPVFYAPIDQVPAPQPSVNQAPVYQIQPPNQASQQAPAQAPKPQPAEKPHVEEQTSPAPKPNPKPDQESQDHPAPLPKPDPKPTQAPQKPQPAPPAQEPSIPEPSTPTPNPEEALHGPVDNGYGHHAHAQPNAQPETQDDNTDIPSGGIAPIDPLPPGENIAPALANKPQHGKDEGNTFCVGQCYASAEEAECAKPFVSIFS